MGSIADSDVQDFLNTAPTRGEYQQGDVRSLWFAARKSLKNLGCSLAVEGTDVKKKVCRPVSKTVCRGHHQGVPSCVEEQRIN